MSFLLNSYMFGGAPGALLAPLLTDGDSFFAPVVAAGAVALTPALFTDGDTFFVPVVGAPPLQPSLLTDGDTFFAPVVAPGVATLAPGLLTNANTFPVPDVHPSDAYFSSVKLLVHFTGSNGSTTFDDESTANRTLTANGNAQIQSNKLELDGTGDYVTAPDSADWQITADYTIELFDVEFDAVNVLQELVGHFNVTGNQRGWILGFDGTTNTLRISVSTAGTSGTTTNHTWAWTPSSVTPYDICVERSGSTLRAYVDGVLLASNITYSGASFNSNQVLGIGVRGGSTDELDGRFKAIRLTKGVARYANDGGYTVPPLPLPSQ